MFFYYQTYFPFFCLKSIKLLLKQLSKVLLGNIWLKQKKNGEKENKEEKI